ncbi:SAM-dependent methyltransferase [Alkalihalobacillus xiaoxiensis]|uniref:SAM-dependent methyltransferase n=1 Tax=Shouchella xiaoxiensis TaxID=766895 RepID=A0ABS2STM2_9BACI|nr:class I SAM-dependent methyltransferase [Shouchella xiaoxiensis]MBM7838878.1 SAM-dependent methyltransferase [Shouchella xiaoxiensis]
MDNQVKEAFSHLATAYANTVDTENLYNSAYERPAMLQQLESDLSGQEILDAGCAAGWYSSELLKRGASVTACDGSEEMVAAAKNRLQGQGNVICLNLEEPLPFPDQSFDTIVSSLTLHYIKDWRGLFSECKRVLKPGGTFLFSVHHPFTDIRLLENPNYFAVERIVDHWTKDGKTVAVPFYRRSLQEIVNDTTTWFSLEKIIEPEPTEEFRVRNERTYEKLLKAPAFLLVKARKGDYPS